MRLVSKGWGKSIHGQFFRVSVLPFFFFNDTAPTEIYPLSLHDALPICISALPADSPATPGAPGVAGESRSEEHTSELQSPCNLVCRLLLEKNKTNETNSSVPLRPHIQRLCASSLGTL